MGAAQYQTGNISITNGSLIVLGDGTEWKTQVNLPAIFKVDLDGESTYSVATIISATRMHLANNYGGSTGSGLGYQLCTSFSISRGYYRPLQGDSDFAEILSQETIDKIDDDISHLMTSYSTGSAIGTNASTFAINMDATLARVWTDNLTASRDYRLPDQSATLAGLGVAQEFSANQTFNAAVGIMTQPNAVALLDIASTTKGFLPPRMTTAQRDDIATPPAGLEVYNTTTNMSNIYNGTIWKDVTDNVVLLPVGRVESTNVEYCKVA